MSKLFDINLSHLFVDILVYNKQFILGIKMLSAGSEQTQK
jgi:hypothetical protein